MASYQIAAVSTLPVIRASRMVFDCVFPSQHHPLRRFLEHIIFDKHRSLVIFLYYLGLFVIAMMPLIEPSAYPVGVMLFIGWLPLCALPCVLMAMLEARVDIIHLFLRTFDFWFLTCLTTAYVICLGGFLRQIRMGIAVIMTFICFVAATLDAVQYISFCELLMPIWTVICVGPLMLASFFNVVPDANNFLVFQFTNHALFAQEVIFNCLGTLSVYGICYTWLYYRTRAKIQRHRRSSSAIVGKKGSLKTTRQRFFKPRYPVWLSRIEIIRYKCDVQWHPVGIEAATSSPTVQDIRRADVYLTDNETTYRSSDVLWPDLLLLAQHHSSLGSMILSGSWICVVASIPILYYTNVSNHHSAMAVLATMIPTLAFLSAALALVFAIGLAHRQAIKRVVRNFDFVFLSVQFTIAHGCACDVFYWESGVCWLIMASWCWSHWLLLVDACSPDVRAAFRMRTRWRIPLTLVYLLTAQAVLGMDLLFLQRFRLQDRQLFEIRIHGTTTASFGVVSTMLARFMTLTPYCLRLLYRHLYRKSDHDLLLLQGSIEYDGDVAMLAPRLERLRRQWQRYCGCCCTRFNRTRIAPSP